MNVQVSDIPSQLKELLQQVQTGETLTLYEGDQPIAEIKPIPSAVRGNGRRPYGLARGEFVVPDNFDDPLPEEILRTFESE